MAVGSATRTSSRPEKTRCLQYIQAQTDDTFFWAYSTVLEWRQKVFNKTTRTILRGSIVHVRSPSSKIFRLIRQPRHDLCMCPTNRYENQRNQTNTSPIPNSFTSVCNQHRLLTSSKNIKLLLICPKRSRESTTSNCANARTRNFHTHKWHARRLSNKLSRISLVQSKLIFRQFGERSCLVVSAVKMLKGGTLAGDECTRLETANIQPSKISKLNHQARQFSLSLRLPPALVNLKLAMFLMQDTQPRQEVVSFNDRDADFVQGLTTSS